MIKPKIDMHCPDCGEASVYHDATVYWLVEKQSWELSDWGGTGRFECSDCGSTFRAPEQRPAAERLSEWQGSVCGGDKQIRRRRKRTTTSVVRTR